MKNIYKLHFKKLLKIYRNWFIVFFIYLVFSSSTRFAWMTMFHAGRAYLQSRLAIILAVLFLLPLLAAIRISFAETVSCAAKQEGEQWRRPKYDKLYKKLIRFSYFEHLLVVITLYRMIPPWLQIIVGLLCIGALFFDSDKWRFTKKLEKGDESKRKITEKIFCTYLNTEEFFGTAGFSDVYGYDCVQEMKGLKKEASDYFDKILGGNGEYLLCPYWFFREAIAEKRTVKKKKLIVSIDSRKLEKFSEKHIRIILDLVNQFLADGDAVMIIMTEHYEELSELKGKLIDELRKLPVKMIKDISAYEADVEQFLLGEVSAKGWERLSELHKFCVEASEKDKEYFISNSILNMSQDSEPADDFYRLLRMVEYCVHYRALYLVSTGKAKIQIKDGVFQPGMGEWCKMQEIDPDAMKWETGSKEVAAYGVIAGLLKKPLPEGINYNDICGLLKDLRNKFIGHGTMAFSVSGELLDAVAVLATVVFEVFYKDGFLLTEKSKDENGVALVNDVSVATALLVAIYDGESPLHEYLDYQNGAITADQTDTRQLLYFC